MVHRLAPLLGCSAPVGRDVAQRQPDQLGGRIVAGEMPARLDDLAQLAMQALDGVGGVDHAAHRRREREELDHTVPRPAPASHHGGVLLAPRSLLELVQGQGSRLGAGRGINRPECRGQQLAVLPARVVQAVLLLSAKIGDGPCPVTQGASSRHGGLYLDASAAGGQHPQPERTPLHWAQAAWLQCGPRNPSIREIS